MLILSIPYLNPEFVRKHSVNNSFVWKEYRLDYNRDLNSFPLEILNEKSIITIRDLSEGGQNSFNFRQKISFYQKAVNFCNCLVDLEIQSYESGLINPENLILSYHDFTPEFDSVKLKNIVSKMNLSEALYAKIAVGINSYEQLLQISDQIADCNKPIILAGMGKKGKICRLLHKHLGAEATIIGLENNETGSGQIFSNDVDLYNLQSISSNSKIGGIIGGKQVARSLGLKFYNSHFQKNQLDSFYFPFETDHVSDLLLWLKKCSFSDRIHGFSITMPFKTSFIGNPINLYILRKNLYFDTDREAFLKAIEKISVSTGDRILIYGSGAMAETALQVLKDFSHLMISCRNKVTSNFLADKYRCQFQNIEDVRKTEFDLLINCTPIGMNGEDFLVETGISQFLKVIDLPYCDGETKLIEFCRQKALPCIDGKQFWQWQAERQLTEFTREIQKIPTRIQSPP